MVFSKWLLICVAVALVFVSCNSTKSNPTATLAPRLAAPQNTFTEEPLQSIKSDSTAIPGATLDPRLATPQSGQVEEPLQGRLVDIPEVWVATSRQSERALVSYLYPRQEPEATDKLLQQLELVNPALSDPILPGTLVVIPPVYRVSEREPLSAVAQTMGFSEDLMRATNPGLDTQTPLNQGTVVVLPRLYIVPQDTLLNATADVLQTSDKALI